ncbi:hypothetical protein ENSA5_39770 [Enhygromyxa salina]|uniref:Uncharacterized protein n=1 Tax=Enhygromyxa salina TaxID=215803 RepID=A0A2S9XRA1_9BACT|nr:hypothetical protein ENSA5_39770 [Enhygromyxa salina]
MVFATSQREHTPSGARVGCEPWDDLGDVSRVLHARR